MDLFTVLFSKCSSTFTRKTLNINFMYKMFEVATIKRATNIRNLVFLEDLLFISMSPCI